MNDNRVRGRCLCGAVQFATPVAGRSVAAGRSVGACHCNICRTWGGGPLLALGCGTQVDFEGSEHIATFASTAWAHRGFCSKCGTHLFIRVNKTGRYIMPAGLFAPDADLIFDHQIFIDKKPGYYAFANETRKLTGAEAFADHPPT